jgi:hypothetical protein
MRWDGWRNKEYGIKGKGIQGYKGIEETGI